MHAHTTRPPRPAPPPNPLILSLLPPRCCLRLRLYLSLSTYHDRLASAGAGDGDGAAGQGSPRDKRGAEARAQGRRGHEKKGASSHHLRLCVGVGGKGMMRELFV